MRKIVHLALLLLVFTAFGLCAQVNLSIVADNYALAQREHSSTVPGGVEVGVEALPKLELVGKLAVDKWQWQAGSDSSGNSVLYPGLGVRYTVWKKNKLSAYGFGAYNWRLNSDADSKVSFVNCGLGFACRLHENFALLGEAGLQRNETVYEEGVEASNVLSYNNLGLRFYF